MNKVELLQEKYNAKKNDMSKEELLKFNERLLKSFLSDKKFNDGVFWAYSEITDRVIEDLKEKNAQLITDNRLDNKGNKGYIDNLELELEFQKRLNNEKHVELNRVIEECGKLEKNLTSKKQIIARLNADLQVVRSYSNQLSYQAKSYQRDVLFFRQAIKEQRDIVIDEIIKLLDIEVGSYSSIFQKSEIRMIKDLKNKIKEMGNK